MKLLVTAAAFAIALIASAGSAYACKPGECCCDCCKDQPAPTQPQATPQPHH